MHEATLRIHLRGTHRGLLTQADRLQPQMLSCIQRRAVSLSMARPAVSVRIT